MPRPSRLHVPRVPARPGEAPDFSYVSLSPAGAVARPDVNAAPADIENLSVELIRVLDDEHVAVGPWNPHLDVDVLQVALRHMVLTRVFDDRMLRTQRQGKISFYMKSTGEEAVAIAAAMALRPSDMLFPAYRQQGLQFVRGARLVELMCQLLSNTHDMCKGRQLPVMYHSVPGRIFSISGNLATQFPQAVGWAMAAAIKGEDSVAATWIGEGSSAEADFHCSLPCIRRRSSSTSSTTSGRSRRSRATRVASSGRSRRVVPATGSRGFGWMATTSWPYTPRPSGRRSAHARAPAPR